MVQRVNISNHDIPANPAGTLYLHPAKPPIDQEDTPFPPTSTNPIPHTLSPRPLPRTLRLLIASTPLPLGPNPPLLSIQDETEHIERELGILETHLAETALGLVPQHVRALAPEGGDGPADGVVRAGGVAVDVAGVGEFRGGGGGDEVDFGVGEGFELLF